MVAKELGTCAPQHVSEIFRRLRVVKRLPVIRLKCLQLAPLTGIEYRFTSLQTCDAQTCSVWLCIFILRAGSTSFTASLVCTGKSDLVLVKDCFTPYFFRTFEPHHRFVPAVPAWWEAFVHGNLATIVSLIPLTLRPMKRAAPPFAPPPRLGA